MSVPRTHKRRLRMWARNNKLLVANILVAANVVLVGTIFYKFVEQLDWVDALYFTVITLATVGYGDITPQTDLGKLFTVVFTFVGVGIIMSLAGSIADWRVNSLINRSKKKSYEQRQRDLKEKRHRRSPYDTPVPDEELY